MSFDISGTRPHRHRESRKSRAQILHDRSAGCCGYCGCDLDSSNRTRDHIVPRTKGGRTQTDNLMLACLTCNQRKAHHDLETFRDRHFNGSAFWFEIVKEGLV